MRIDESQDASLVRPLLERWREICHGEEFGLTANVTDAEADLQARLNSACGTLLIAYDGVGPVGFFAVFSTKSSLSEQGIAVETFWFAVPNHKLAGPALYHRAKLWAKEQGCTHLVVSASRLASGLHDKVVTFCERQGMKPFETVFIERLE